MPSKRVVRGQYVGTALVALLAAACGADPTSDAPNAEAPPNAVATFGNRNELPNCNPSRTGEVYYVESEQRFYYCDGLQLQTIAVTGEPGADGTSWLVATSDAGPSDCPQGGVLIHVGPDRDGDGALDAAEIASSGAICNGADGAPGSQGATGPQGAPGKDGGNGGSCHVRDNGDGTKTLYCDDGTEVTIRDGANGAGASGDPLIRITLEGRGANCAFGGHRVEVGLDANANGVLEDSEITSVDYACNGSNPLVAVSAGDNHNCGVRVDGTIACWGLNNYAQSSPPSGQFESVSAGAFHGCGINLDRTVLCWGNDGTGQLNAPQGQFLSVSSGTHHSCGVRLDGSVTCWGHNGYGQLNAPQGQFLSVSAGQYHTCGVRLDGTVACWGDIAYGPSGAPPGQFQSVSSGGADACGVKLDGTVLCWGANYSGTKPSGPLGKFQSVSSGWSHACGVRLDGTVACWGNNSFGQLNAPQGQFLSVASGNAHSCGLHADGTVVCWGDNSSGQAPAVVH